MLFFPCRGWQWFVQDFLDALEGKCYFLLVCWKVAQVFFKGGIFTDHESFNGQLVGNTLFSHLEEHVNNLRIKMIPRLCPNISQRFVVRPSQAIGTIGGQRIPNIYDREQTRRKRDFLTPESERVPRSIPFFMMAIRDIECRHQEDNGLEQIVRILRMLPHK